MDVKMHVTHLRVYSKQLGQLFTEASATDKALDQSRKTPVSQAAAETQAVIESVVTEHRHLLIDAELLCQRVKYLLDTLKQNA